MSVRPSAASTASTSRSFRTVGVLSSVSVLVSIAFVGVLTVGTSAPTARAEQGNSLSAGDTHTCAVSADGRAECWGENDRGQLGNGTTTDSTTAVPVSGLTNLTKISAGKQITCAMDSDGNAWCWGANNQGAVNGVVGGNATTPVQLGLTNVIDISAGYTHSCAVVSTGAAYCWGADGDGQLGNGAATGAAISQVSGMTNAAEISASQFSTCARHDDGGVSCWGSNTFGKVGIDPPGGDYDTPQALVTITDAIAIATESGHSCALIEGGTVQCWGANFNGQLGDGSTTSSHIPVTVPGITDAVGVEVSSSGSCAIESNGDVWCWGSNYKGLLGLPLAIESSATPVSMSVPGGTIGVTAGQLHVCALSSTGSVGCWGSNDAGQLGNGSVAVGQANTPMTVSGVVADEVTVGLSMTCAISASQEVSCWGLVDDVPTSPAIISGLSNPDTIDAGSAGSITGDVCSVDTSGALTCFPPATPITMSVGVDDVTVGSSYVCALLTDGTVECLGSNSHGQFGNGSTAPSVATPATMNGVTTATAVSAGGFHTCVILADTTARCAGHNHKGKLGDGTTADRTTPVAVSGLTGIATISPGFGHTCASTTDLTVWCWGNNYQGAVGGADSTTPVQISGLTDVAEVHSGSDFSCARKVGGTVVCWGTNSVGQLGNGTFDPSSVPVTVTGITDAAQLSVGGSTACVRNNDSSVECWGSNIWGNAGQGSWSDTPVPASTSGPVATTTTTAPAGGGPTTTTGSSTTDPGTTTTTGPGTTTTIPNTTSTTTSTTTTSTTTSTTTTTTTSTTTSTPTSTPTTTTIVAALPPEPGEVFTPLTPARFADTRIQPTVDGLYRDTGPRPAGGTWEIQIAERGDVPDRATAAIINLTVLNSRGNGFATVHPCGALPKASSVNYSPGGIEPNEVIARLSNAGSVCVYTKATADVIVDVVGYVADSPYEALTPARFGDSRNQPTVDSLYRDTGPRPAGTTWEIPIAGRGDVPVTATAAVVNLTVTGGRDHGFATVHPCSTLPVASSLNYAPGVTRPNELIAKLSPTGTICVYTKATADVIVDVVGFIEDVPGYTPLTPRRFADSRDLPTIDGQFRNTGRRAGDSSWRIDIAGRGDVPTTATAAVVNLTVTGGTGVGFAAVYPCGMLPKASSINYAVGVSRSNELVAKLSDDGAICVYTKTDVHVIIDVVGHQ